MMKTDRPTGEQRPPTTTVVIEAGAKRVFATVLDWPGWTRGGRDEETALAALAAAAGRYARVAELAGLAFEETCERVAVVERIAGGSGTDFGVPSTIASADRRAVDAADAARLAAIVEAAWTTFERIASAAPAELRKGPRGGGRDTARIVAHVVEAEGAYAREIGLRIRPPAPDDPGAVRAMRDAMLEIVRRPSDGGPLADRRWTQRYAARRIAWHALDHAWEIEDRSEPG